MSDFPWGVSWMIFVLLLETTYAIVFVIKYDD